jgi:hypothetical protein
VRKIDKDRYSALIQAIYYANVFLDIEDQEDDASISDYFIF